MHIPSLSTRSGASSKVSSPHHFPFVAPISTLRSFQLAGSCAHVHHLKKGEVPPRMIILLARENRNARCCDVCCSARVFDLRALGLLLLRAERIIKGAARLSHRRR